MECLVFFFNKKDNSFFAADRMGQKPLLYFKNEDGYVFSSEIKILIRYFKIFLKINNDQVFIL